MIIDSNINYAQIVEFPLYRFIEQHITHKCTYFSCIVLRIIFLIRTIYVHKRRQSLNCVLWNLNLHETPRSVVTFRQSARTCTDTNERSRYLVHALANEIIFNVRIRKGRSIFLDIQEAPFERPIPTSYSREPEEQLCEKNRVVVRPSCVSDVRYSFCPHRRPLPFPF